MKPPLPLINPEITIDWLVRNATGKGLEVAVVDSGVDPHHPDLTGKISRSCLVEKDAEGQVICQEIAVADSVDNFGHGTAVAGIITDIAPDAKIINIKVLNQYNACTGDVLIEGIKWALDQDIKLINMSLATIKSQWVQPLFELCERAYTQDAILVVSRRNMGPLGCPAMFSSVVSVERGEFASKYQTRFKTGNLIECDASGTEITVPAPGGGYVKQTGTSFATPHVAGLIALMLEIWPGMVSPEVKALLKSLSLAGPPQ